MVFVEMLIKFLEVVFWVMLFHGLIFSVFWFARAGWERSYDKNKNLNVHKIETATFSNCKMIGAENNEPKTD